MSFFCRVEYTFTFTEDYPGESLVYVYLYSLKQQTVGAHWIPAISAAENTIVCCSLDKDSVSVLSEGLTYAVRDICSGKVVDMCMFILRCV